MTTSHSSRPIYETPTDLANEQAVVDLLAAKWGCVFRKLPMQYRIDFMAFRDEKPVAVVEVKKRNAKYPEMMISLQKVLSGLQLSEFLRVPFLMVYAFPGEIFYKQIEQGKFNVSWGGRKDRADAQDMEPMIMLELEGMNKI